MFELGSGRRGRRCPAATSAIEDDLRELVARADEVRRDNLHALAVTRLPDSAR